METTRIEQNLRTAYACGEGGTADVLHAERPRIDDVEKAYALVRAIEKAGEAAK